MPQIDPTLLIAGFRGRFFFGDGTPFGAISTWQVNENYSNAQTQPVDHIVPINVLQSVGFTLAFTEITIDDTLPVQRLQALRERRQLNLRFIGEVERPDGNIGRYVCNSCVYDGQQGLAGANPGNTMTRDVSMVLNEVPDIASALGA